MILFDQLVSQDSWVRVIDLFVKSLPMNQFDFTHKRLNEEGRLPYNPSTLLKLYVYRYKYSDHQGNWNILAVLTCNT